MRKRSGKSGEWSDWINGEEEPPTVTEQSAGAITKSDFDNRIVPTAPSVDGTTLSVRVQPNLVSLFADPLVIQELEMKRLIDTAEERPLDDKEISKYRDLVDTLVKLSKEQRAINAKIKMDDLTDAELMKTIKEISKDVLGE